MTRQSKTYDLSVNHLAAQDPSAISAVAACSADDIETVIQLLNDVLATELISVLRYRCHHFVARAIHSHNAANEFMTHATAELRHVDLLAERIVQLGGTPNFSPDGLTQRSHTGYMPGDSLASMVREDLTAVGILIDSYRDTVAYLGNHDAITRHMLEDILATEEEHADDLSELLVARFRANEGRLETHWQALASIEVALQPS